MKEWKITVLLADTYEEIFLYTKACNEDEALQKSLKENGYKQNEVIIRDVVELKK